METPARNDDGIKLAQLYKYFAQCRNPRIEHKLPLSMVKAKGLYMQNKQKFDKLAAICSTYSIDPEKYFKFLVFQLGKGERDAAEAILSRVCMSKYVDYLRVQSQYQKIYKWFWKSAKNIADECVQLGMSSTSEYFQHLVAAKLLAAKYMSGKISAYYLCAIQNLKDIISKLDTISQAELSTISNRYDKYRMDITEAFRLHKSCKLRPIELTDALIRKKTKERQQTTNDSK